MDPANSFGLWIKRRRRELDLTQEALAEQVGCAVQTIRKLESGARRPSAVMADRLAHVLELPAEERPLFLSLARRHATVAPPSSVAERQAGRGALPASNLPVQRDPLIGRERELAAILELLRRDDVGLVTLVGPGGTGKTRLAVQVAAELLRDFPELIPDGAWLVDLAPIDDAALVAWTVASVLGVKDAGGSPVEEALRRYLRDKQLMLLLDNFEQVVAAAPLLAGLLEAAARLKLLVTSRLVLHLSGEQEYPVLPLALPERRRAGQPPLALERLAQSPAVELFVTRARRVRPEFQLTDQNAAAIVEICTRLDGLPLAIELAAARCKLFTPQALLPRLARSLQILTGGPQDHHARHQTLRSTIDWSYRLLAVEERRLFTRLGIFVGSYTLEAAEAVCSAPPSQDATAILDGLASLVDKSLLRQEDGPGGEPRFRMLETIREYALELLAAAGEEEVLRQRHAAYYATFAEQAEPELIGPREVEWLDRVEQEHDNLRAVFQWALRPESGPEHKLLALRIAAGIWWFWRKRGYYAEGRRWLAALLAATGSIPARDSAEWITLRAKALRGAGRMALDLADNADGLARFEAARALSEQVGDKAGLAEALNNLGWVPTMQGDFARGVALFEQSLRLYRELDDKRGIASALYTLAYAAQAQGDLTRAVALLEESQPLFRLVKDTGGLGWSFWLLGTIARLRRDYRRAVALHEEAVRLFRSVGEKWGLSASLESLGFEVGMLGDYQRAGRFHQESFELYREMGYALGIGTELISLARLARTRTDYRQAVELLEESVTVLREAGDPIVLAWALQEWAVVARDQGDYARAVAGFEEAAAIYRATDCKTDLVWCLQHIGLAHWLQGDYQEAGALLRHGLVLMHQVCSAEGIAWGLAGLAGVLADQELPLAAARLGGAAEALCEQIGIVWEEPATRVVCEAALERARVQLGDAEWTESWAEGRAMPVEQAIDDVLRGTPDLRLPVVEKTPHEQSLTTRRRGLPSMAAPLHKMRS